MLESFMEDLLWKYPDDFFPGKGFEQAERQFTLAGARRGDISFRDSSERLWVIEVKAAPIRTEVADQVYRYVEALRLAHPNVALIPAVVAPMINATVRGHFDRWGIEHFEIKEATFRRVASERGISVEPEPEIAAGRRDSVRRTNSAKGVSAMYVFEAIPAGYVGSAQGILAATGEPGTRRGGLPYPVHYVADQRSACGQDWSAPWPAGTRLGVNVRPTDKSVDCGNCLKALDGSGGGPAGTK